MTQAFASRRALALLLGGALALSGVQASQAAPFPTPGGFDTAAAFAAGQVEEVQYRRHRVKRRGGDAAAAAILGALAIGAAAVAANQAKIRAKRRAPVYYDPYYAQVARPRFYDEQPSYYSGPQYIPPQPRVYQTPRYRAPTYEPRYAPPPQRAYRGGPQGRGAPITDGSKVYDRGGGRYDIVPPAPPPTVQ